MMLLTMWLSVVGASFLWTMFDVWTHPDHTMLIMNLVWPLVALYFHPFGVSLYVVLSGRFSKAHRVLATPSLPAGATNLRQTATVAPHGRLQGHHLSGMDDPLWIRSARSSTHCMAGCALGDLTAMLVVEGMGWTVVGNTAITETVMGAIFAFLFYFSGFPHYGREGYRGYRCLHHCVGGG